MQPSSSSPAVLSCAHRKDDASSEATRISKTKCKNHAQSARRCSVGRFVCAAIRQCFVSHWFFHASQWTTLLCPHVRNMGNFVSSASKCVCVGSRINICFKNVFAHLFHWIFILLFGQHNGPRHNTMPDETKQQQQASNALALTNRNTQFGIFDCMCAVTNIFMKSASNCRRFSVASFRCAETTVRRDEAGIPIVTSKMNVKDGLHVLLDSISTPSLWSLKAHPQASRTAIFFFSFVRSCRQWCTASILRRFFRFLLFVCSMFGSSTAVFWY